MPITALEHCRMIKLSMSICVHQTLIYLNYERHGTSCVILVHQLPEIIKMSNPGLL